MSSRFTTTCFDLASEYLDWLTKEVLDWLIKDVPRRFSSDIKSLKVEVELLKIIFLSAKKGRTSNKCDIWGCLSFRIKDVVSRIPNDLHSTFLASGIGTSGIGGPSIEKHSDAQFLIETGIERHRENIKFLWTDTKELYINLLDQYPPYSPGDPKRLMDLFDSFAGYFKVLRRLYLHKEGYMYEKIKDLEGGLKFSRYFILNFISFATTQGVDQMSLTDLLIQLERVAVNVARRIVINWFDGDGYNRRKLKKMHLEISQLIQKINPVDADPQLRETYIHILTASKLSRSSTSIFSREKDRHTVAANFIDSLLSILKELLESCTNFNLSVTFQMQKLQEGVIFLRILPRKQHKNFISLHDELKDLIGVVFIDAATVICSLSVDELEQGLSKETELALLDLLEVLKFIMPKVAHFYPPSFPGTNELGSFDFLLKNLKELASCEVGSIAFLKDQIQIFQEDLVFLRSFLENIGMQRNQNKKLQAIWNRVVEVACRVEFVIDSLMVGYNCSPMSLDDIIEEIKFLKTEALEIYESLRHDIQAQRITENFTHMPSQVSAPTSNEFLVGFDKEAETIIELLTRGPEHQDVVSIVGMPGVGKTSLASKIYYDPSINYHFHIRAWCTVSQVYSKKSLLLEILGDIDCNHDEDDLAEKLYKRLRLKGNRYLVVLDDVWEVEALNLLDCSFPNDENGSRILFTSRFQNLKSDSKLHRLGLLNVEQCWELLQKKLFGKEFCPPTLRDVVMKIAKSCKGLPLTVVIVAGILATIKPDCWEDVANSLSSSTADVSEHCKETLELSYGYLPDYLKSCLLYFGAFREDKDIRVRRLLWLWISEGFVQKNERKSLEEVAEEYMMELIARSLVMVTRQRTIGGAKTCRLHDLLHEFCLKKAKEESFLHLLHMDNELLPTTLYNPQRLCIYFTRAKPWVYFVHLRSLLFFAGSKYLAEDILFIFQISNLLRVLNVGDVFLRYFPQEVLSLIQLRYLAILFGSTYIPPGIANLSRLETFIVRSPPRDVLHVALPNTVWNIKKLRLLWSTNGFRFPTDNLEVSPNLHHLETLTLAIDSDSQSFQKIIRKLPNIRKLKCFVKEHIGECQGVIVPGQLESLYISRSLPGFESPANLKKLTLTYNQKPWRKISTIGKLPNLQVLKLLEDSFVGETWELKEGEFLNLRFLKLEDLDICRWISSCDHFPPLQQLVLTGCRNLESFPSFLSEIPTLEMIEVKYYHEYAIRSLKQIEQEQMDLGNGSLKIVIHAKSRFRFID